MSDRTAERIGAEIAGLQTVRENWPWLLGLGILWIILGVLAIIMPFAATIALDLLLGGIFFVGGIAQFVQAFRMRGWRGFALHAVGGVLAIVLGGLLLMFPLEGALTVTLFLSAFFLVEGALKVAWAFQHRAFANWAWVLLSGILGILIGALIWLGWPATAVWALGLLVGIELMFSGWAMIMLALSARSS